MTLKGLTKKKKKIIIPNSWILLGWLSNYFLFIFLILCHAVSYVIILSYLIVAVFVGLYYSLCPWDPFPAIQFFPSRSFSITCMDSSIFASFSYAVFIALDQNSEQRALLTDGKHLLEQNIQWIVIKPITGTIFLSEKLSWGLLFDLESWVSCQ